MPEPFLNYLISFPWHHRITYQGSSLTKMRVGMEGRQKIIRKEKKSYMEVHDR
jgi:hypothetical protein